MFSELHAKFQRFQMGNPYTRMKVNDSPAKNLRGSNHTPTRVELESPLSKKRKLETPTSFSPIVVESSVRKSRGRPKGSCNKVKKNLGIPVTGEKSPIKTRRKLKSNNTNPHCTLCKRDRKEDLKSCFQCGLFYHLSHCLAMLETQVKFATEQEEWHCPKCIRCAKCFGVISDVCNVECFHCLKAWCGDCFQGRTEDKFAVCKKCFSKSTLTELSSSIRTNQKPGSSKSKGRPPVQKRALPKGWHWNEEHKESSSIYEDGSSARSVSANPTEDASQTILCSREKVWNNLVDELNKTIYPNPIKRDRRSRSPEKKITPITTLPTLPVHKISTPEDNDLFQAALTQFFDEGNSLHEQSSLNNYTSIGKWVYFDDSSKMKALYSTPYPEEVLCGDVICVCPYCLFPTCHTDIYQIHRDNCDFHHPPGNEIYREGDISFFEVDGATQSQYCRNLCLLSKMFISSKTLHHEVETFYFYILTQTTSSGCRMIGYFSKEKNPSKNNNLSCLLILPIQNKRGYGKLLIDLSYKLSELEHKIGSPEHPLSDLGLFAYRGYWRASILQHLRSLHNVQSTSIKSIALKTRINPSDIVSQLMRDKLLAYVDGNYFIKTGKRAYKWPLSYFRRRAIDEKKLVWAPDFDISELDPNKLNYYV